MKRNYLLHLLLLTGIGIFSLNITFGQVLIPHPVPEEFAATQYSVTVNDKPVQVFHAGLNVYFASFDFEGKVDVKVTVARIRSGRTSEKLYSGQVRDGYTQSMEGAEFWAGNASVKPLSKKINPKTDGATVTFELSEPGQYSVERPGTSNYKDQVLFLFANKPESAKPDKSDKNVIWLEPGIHHRDIELKSGETLYMEAGSVLFGSLDIWDAKGVKVIGRGVIVYYGPQSEIIDMGYKHLEKWHPLTAHNVEKLDVSGVTVIGRSRTWIVQLRAASDVVFDNVKVIAAHISNTNGDGFDFQGGERIKVINSFIRCADDIFAFFPSNPIIYVRDPGQFLVDKYPGVKDVLIENCVIWSTLANVYRLVPGGKNFFTDKIVMRNSDLLHHGIGYWWSPWSMICTIDPSKKENSVHTNYMFENVRFEEPVPFLGIQGGRAQLTNIVFKDITMTGKPDSSLFEGVMDGLVFENVTVDGKKLTKVEDILFKKSSSDLKAIKFK